ncbi:Endopolyphosphatase [Trichodelitschia bisporula]|uniref:Endopolyphosphatase n=1 Tax=Trichodelitschia bisporula TaxID=703511 RepID=A0A6G1I0K9_9PEZI|nr:Endopolyphosphatase [Trichodelitschia bisporula]
MMVRGNASRRPAKETWLPAPGLLLLLLALLLPLSAARQDAGADGTPVLLGGGAGRRLKGRFLHINDFHFDPYYKLHSSTEKTAACHRGKGPAGYFGAETSACDSPEHLINATFEWIRTHLRDEIDFVVWAGDSARHDNDEEHPRSDKQVVTQNEFLVSKFRDVFGVRENWEDDDPTNDVSIPIIPTFGNNDVLPHNIFLPGPNPWTNRYLSIWRHFIPEAQRHTFQQGGWFYVEVIPDHLAVISLNTLYFFDSNAAVDGCASRHEPGYEHFDWLRIQLQSLRERGMKAILTGHVPPARVDSKVSWDETCWQKYAQWTQAFRDVLVGSFFGHMNIDHFIIQDSADVDKGMKKGRAVEYPSEDEVVRTASAEDYLLDLREVFQRLPGLDKAREGVDVDEEAKIGGPYAERFAMSFVGASVVPNYFPSLRVYEYNITGLEDLVLPRAVAHPDKLTTPHIPSAQQPLGNSISSSSTPELDLETLNDDPVDEEALIEAYKKKKKQKKGRKKPKTHKFTPPREPPRGTGPGPAYTMQRWALLGYTQYYANLTHMNGDFTMDHEDGEREREEGEKGDAVGVLEVARQGTGDEIEEERWSEGRHGGKTPRHGHGKVRIGKFGYEVEYDTRRDKVYRLEDLTVRSYLGLAGRIAKGKARGWGVRVDEAEGEVEGQEVEEDEGDVESEGKKHKKGKKGKKRKGKKKHKKGKVNDVWMTFVERAFVGALEPDDLEELFDG